MYAYNAVEVANQEKGDNLQQETTNIILCKAVVLHKDDEIEMRRYVEKVTRGRMVSEIDFWDQKKRAIIKHISLTAGITGIIIFVILFAHELEIHKHELSLELLSNIWFTPTLAAIVTVAVEFFIFLRDY